MNDIQGFRVALDPTAAFQRIRNEVPGCYWLDVLNYLFVRKPFVGFLGAAESTIWCNRFGRSANRPRLRIFLEQGPRGCRIDYRIDPPFVGDLFFTMKEDEEPLRNLVQKLFADVRIEPEAPPTSG